MGTFGSVLDLSSDSPNQLMILILLAIYHYFPESVLERTIDRKLDKALSRISVLLDVLLSVDENQIMAMSCY